MLEGFLERFNHSWGVYVKQQISKTKKHLTSAGDKIIRRSPRKLPEAAKAAIDPATGVIPYSFACTVGNTQGVIPHGLTEKHFISYRPAKKRASNHWCEELLQSLEGKLTSRLQT